MVIAVVDMDGVEPRMNTVTQNKDVNPNLVNVQKEDVVSYGDRVLKDNVVVKKEIVVPLQNSVPLL